jgi:hypothetical protein
MKERPNLTYEEDKRYRVKCQNCGQYIEFNTHSYEEAFKLYNAMFEGQTLYPIEDLHEDDGFVFGWALPIEEPPDIISVVDTDYDESKYTHFSYLPNMRWIEKDGKVILCKYWEVEA